MAFVLGAGASKPTPSGIPTVKELLPQLLERARRLDREDVSKLADFCDERQITNIEDLLTAAQLSTFCSKSPTVLGLLNYLLYREEQSESEEPGMMGSALYRKRRGRSNRTSADMSSVAFLQDTLQVLFGLLASTMLPAAPNKAHEAIATYCTTKPETAIITTNYDCCMDLALAHAKQNFEYKVEFAKGAHSPKGEGIATRLIKLHGSLNWYYCETCQEVQLVEIARMLKQYETDEAPYPVIGICKDCGGQRRGLLVPPYAMKFDVAPPLTPLLSEANNAFASADLIAVVGFSFAEADVYISRMLSKSMQVNENQQLLIVDPSTEVVNRIRRKFKASIPDFDSNRIVRMSGDCADLLPKFLGGHLKAAVVPNESPATNRRHSRAAAKGQDTPEPIPPSV
jgi:NAD-dependent SIR2 family protein deacetylase